MPKKDAAAVARIQAKRIVEQTIRNAGKGFARAVKFFESRVKETLSTPAPRKRMKDEHGNIYYRATTPARPKAPPRMVSGNLRRSLTSQMLTDMTAVIGTNVRSLPRYGTNTTIGGKKIIWAKPGFPYGKYHELVQPGMPGSGKHQYIQPTFEKYKNNIYIIVGRAVTLGV